MGRSNWINLKLADFEQISDGLGRIGKIADLTQLKQYYEMYWEKQKFDFSS